MHNLAAYIPMDRRQALAHGEKLPDHCTGAALFADVSGFTPLTRALAEELGPKRGAEALMNILNPLFDALITPLHYYRGSVIGFVGDAITCWFNSTEAYHDALSRAVACALAMQTAMEPFTTVQTAAGTEVTLNIKIAVAAGPARRFIVGDPATKCIDTLAGTTLARMAATEHHAERGEVVVSQEVVEHLGTALIITEKRADARYAVVQNLATTITPQPWPTLADDNLLPATITHRWLLSDVREQLEGGYTVGDLRPVSPLMLRFGGIDFDTDAAAGEKLNTFVTWAQHIIHRHGGALLQLTIGDKGAFLYATFGAPIAHEDDPMRALQAALALHDLPPHLADYITPVQIGITRGLMWTGNSGGHGRFAYSVIGSEVNLAARLMSKAQPGQILVSKELATTQGFKIQHMGDWHYKGFANPLPTYELCSEQLAETNEFPEIMVGRGAEMQKLEDFAQPLFTGKLAGAALIYGEPGIGKSRLAYALRQALDNTVTWCTGQTDQILHQPFNPFIYWLKRYFHQSLDAATAENQARFEKRFDQLCISLELSASQIQIPSSDFQHLVSELTRTRSFLGASLGLHWPDSLYEQLDDPKLRHENTLIAIKTLLLAESCLRPVVFELEDGQWLDTDSQEMLLALSRNVADYPLLIVITSRYKNDGSKPDFELDQEIPLLTLDLDILSMNALEQQATALLDGPVDSGLLDLLWKRSHANPFFTEQILHHFRENGLLTTTSEGICTAPATDIDLPIDVNTMLIARIDRLAAQVKDVVQTAAVLGREFEVRLLSQILTSDDIFSQVQQAEQEQIWSLLSELRYIFKHALLRDAAYKMQLQARLRDLHYLAAAAIEQLYAKQLAAHYGRLAYHYETAYQLGTTQAGEKARHYLQQAGQQALANFENRNAVDYLSRALILTAIDDKENRYHLLISREEAYNLLGEREAQANDLTALQQLTTSQADNKPLSSKWAQRQAIVLYHQANYASDISDYATAIELAEMGIKIAQTAADATTQVEIQAIWGKILWLQSAYLAAQEHFALGVEIAQSAIKQLPSIDKQMQSALAHNLNGLGIVTNDLGDYERARNYYKQSLLTYQEIDSRWGVSTCLNNLGIVAKDLGNYKRSTSLL